MSTQTVTATITYPTTEIEAFADRLGYSSQVPNPDFDENDPNSVAHIDNPQTKIEFVGEKFKENAAEWFAQFAQKDAEAAARQQTKAVKAAVASAITIS